MENISIFYGIKSHGMATLILKSAIDGLYTLYDKQWIVIVDI